MLTFHATFLKVNGDIRSMRFVHLKDMPKEVLDSKCSGNMKKYKEGSELVWDIEKDNFRVFNWNTKVGKVIKQNIKEDVVYP